MVLLDADAFLTHLTRILEKSRGSGTVQITMKRCALLPCCRCPRIATAARSPFGRCFCPSGCIGILRHSPACGRGADAGKEVKLAAKKEGGDQLYPDDCKCLIRAIGNKKKISALISAKDYSKFMQSYGNILKISLDSLKKREKKKPEKKKTAAS